jgi:histone H3
VALREIRKHQKGTGLLLKGAPFERFVREIAQGYMTDLRFEKNAILAIQEAAEQYVIDKLALAQSLAIHSDRETLQPRDLRFATAVKRDSDGPVA